MCLVFFYFYLRKNGVFQLDRAGSHWITLGPVLANSIQLEHVTSPERKNKKIS